MKEVTFGRLRDIGCGGTSFTLVNRGDKAFLVAENETNEQEMELEPEFLDKLRSFLTAFPKSPARQSEAEKILSGSNRKRK